MADLTLLTCLQSNRCAILYRMIGEHYAQLITAVRKNVCLFGEETVGE